MRYGSLFAGAGGVDLGFDAAGWECAWQVEIDPAAQKVLAHWWPNVDRRSDIVALEADTVEPVGLIVGGFPCQDLSVAGNRAGMVEGTRSGLFFEFVRIVQEMRDATAGASPRWVVWENVAGLLSLGNTLGSVYAAWDGIGAVVQEHRLIDTGRAFGVPQRRRRVLGVVGFDPRAESAPAVLAEPEGVRRDPEASREAGQEAACLTANGVGGGGGADDNAGQAGHLIPTRTGTVTTKPHDRGPWILDGIGVRRLTPVECERLMGWPDGHTEPAGADSHRYRLCGNGVVAPAAEWLAQRIERTEELL